MVKTQDREFSDDEGSLSIKSTQLPATRAFRLMNRLGKLLGPALGQLKGVKLKSDASTLLPALASLFETLEPDDADGLIVAVLESTLAISAQGAIPLSSTANIDKVFSGRLPLLLKVMAFAVEVNFASFFRDLTRAADVKSVQASA